jgi:two-component system response regulator PilR (NtrC family)
MAEVRAQVRRVAPQQATILLTGETGTGKTRLARLVHELSPRRQEPFLVVDCGALSPTLVESEIFGHVKGAFTGADRDRSGKLSAVGNGTLLLDEINSLPRELQSKLLRATDERAFEPLGSNQTQTVQARLIAAANVDLGAEVQAGRFRADLYYRLNVVGFHLPPLRERRPSIVRLAEKFLADFAARNRPDVRGLTAEAAGALQRYAWPGNVRELRNVIERAVSLCAGPVVEVGDLPEAVRRAEPLTAAPPPPVASAPAACSLAQSCEEAEVQRIREALAKHRNNRLRAAAELGISRMGLYKKLHKYRLF